jgi:hypothetical protein
MAEEMTAEWQANHDRGADSADPQDRSTAEFFGAIASEHRQMLGKSAELVSAIDSFDDLPLVVIAAGVPNPMFGDVAEEFQEYWIGQSRGLASRSTRGRFIFAEKSTHHLHRDAPDLVRQTILTMVEELRGSEVLREREGTRD